MWLLELHIAISVLCLITFTGFSRIFRDKILSNGWIDGEIKKSGIKRWLIFFVPLLNLLMITVLFVMIIKTKQEVDEMTKEV